MCLFVCLFIPCSSVCQKWTRSSMRKRSVQRTSRRSWRESPAACLSTLALEQEVSVSSFFRSTTDFYYVAFIPVSSRLECSFMYAWIMCVIQQLHKVESCDVWEPPWTTRRLGVFALLQPSMFHFLFTFCCCLFNKSAKHFQQKSWFPKLYFPNCQVQFILVQFSLLSIFLTGISPQFTLWRLLRNSETDKETLSCTYSLQLLNKITHLKGNLARLQFSFLICLLDCDFTVKMVTHFDVFNRAQFLENGGCGTHTCCLWLTLRKVIWLSQCFSSMVVWC